MKKIGNIEVTPTGARLVFAMGDRDAMNADVKFTVNGDTIEVESHGTQLGILVGISSLVRRIARNAKEAGMDLDVHELCETIELLSTIIDDTDHHMENIMTCAEVLAEATEE